MATVINPNDALTEMVGVKLSKSDMAALAKCKADYADGPLAPTNSALVRYYFRQGLAAEVAAKSKAAKRKKG